MDDKLFRAINHFSGRYLLLDKLMILFSNKIRYVFVFVLIFMWFRNRKTTLNVVVSMLLTLFTSMLIKLFYFRPRPFVKHRVGILIPSKLDSSFPSKHTLLVFAVSTSIFLRNRIVGAVMAVLSLFTGFSRIWLGHHYPADIIASAFIGSFTSIIVDKISDR